ncbi:hypothetical protein NEDG_00324 [Nematocida displodere]|uniref:AN1-type domain-containing protein n=1 Tax=Nematocida displodere TaxID=1805483 RepID=A0A177ELJ6_9MICR|nr:hypothetical protein NEDG_00324 [Nematocida displodere]
MGEAEEIRRKRRLSSEEETRKANKVKHLIDKMFCKRCLVHLRITNCFSCKCSGVFCSKHRYSDEHGCTYDYQLENRLRLEKENPKILPSTISHN